MLVKRFYPRPFSIGDGKIYPPGEYYYTKNRFALTLRRAPSLGPFTSFEWNDPHKRCAARIEYQTSSHGKRLFPH